MDSSFLHLASIGGALVLLCVLGNSRGFNIIQIMRDLPTPVLSF